MHHGDDPINASGNRNELFHYGLAAHVENRSEWAQTIHYEFATWLRAHLRRVVVPSPTSNHPSPSGRGLG